MRKRRRWSTAYFRKCLVWEGIVEEIKKVIDEKTSNLGHEGRRNVVEGILLDAEKRLECLDDELEAIMEKMEE